MLTDNETFKKHNNKEVIGLDMKVFDNVPNPVWLVDDNDKILYHNKAWREFTGEDTGKRKGDGWLELIHEDDRKECESIYISAFKARKPFVMQYRLLHNSGIYRWIEDHGMPFYDSNGIFRGYLGSCYDIHNTKKMQKELIDMKNNLLEAQKIAHVGSWEADLVTGEVHWSDEVFRIFGYAPAQFKPDKDSYKKHLDSKDLEYVEECIKNAMEGNPLRYEVKFTKANGVAGWIYVRGEVQFNNDGKPMRMYGIVQDISNRKWATERYKGLALEYETVFNSTQNALFLIDVSDDGKFYYRRINKSYELMTGYTEEMAIGKTPVEFMGEKLGLAIESNYKRCVAAGEPITFEEELDFPAGHKIWKTTISPVFDGGKIKQLVGAGEDVTEMKKSLKALRESEERYSSLFENNNCIMLLINPENGDIVDANPAACKYYGYSREQITRMNVSDINTLPKERLLRDLNKALDGDKKHLIFRNRLSDGSLRYVETYIGPIYIEGKRLMYSIVYDISERKKYQRELHIEKERLRVTLYSIGEGVITTDTDGNITMMNSIAEKLTGWSQSEALGKPLDDVFKIISAKTGKPLENPAKKVLDTERIIGFSNRTVLLTKSGRKKVISDSGAPIIDTDGEIIGAVLVFRDISEEEERKKKIEYLTFHDKLTGVYNRTYFEEKIKKYEKKKYLPLSIIIGDVNGLKLSNDIFGHNIGDKLLVKIAEIISKACRRRDIICRWGGDEFAIILPNTGSKTALSICERIKQLCLNAPKDPIQPSIAIGCSTRLYMKQSINNVIKEAEDRMYRNKLLESRSARSSIISSLKKTLFERSYETEEHAQRLLNICKKVGAALGLSDSEQDDLNLLAILHDIGKIGISDKILLKPATLENEEWIEMQKHPEIGFRIAQASHELSHIAEYILTHHERWDGNGYPQGLKGTQIPKLSRIISIADAYDAMTNSRPYKQPINHEEALEEIKRCAGTQFDPEIVDVFVKVLSQ